MMLTRVALFFFCAALSQVNSQYAVQTTTAWHSSNGTYRALTVRQTPDGYDIVGLKVQLAGNSQQGSATLDAARFAVGNGGGSNAPGFYLGVLDASVNIQQLGTKSVWAGNVSGAFAEILASFQSIVVYYDLDSVPGFQYVLGDDLTCPSSTSQSGSKDCTDPADNLNLKSDLNYSNVKYVGIPCGPNAPSNCTVHRFEISGYQGSKEIIRFGFTLGSHPLRVAFNDGSGMALAVDPDHGEIDVRIMYDWSTRKNTRQQPKIALVTAVAGKAGVGGAVFVAGTKQVNFVVGAGQATSFGWIPTATTPTNANSQVQVAAYTDAEILAACPLPINNCTVAGSFFVNLGLKPTVLVVDAFGWSCEFVVFSWTDVQPTSVLWDPYVGQGTSPATSTTPNSAGALSVSLFVMIVTYLLHRLF